MNYLILIIIGAAGIWVGYKLAVGKANNLSVANQKKREEKEENKKKVLELLDTKDRIVNNDVENLLGVSDATATNYLSELEAEGKLKQIGETGKYTYYEKANG